MEQLLIPISNEEFNSMVNIRFKLKIFWMVLICLRTLPLKLKILNLERRRELFFVTFYFYNKLITIWGNYNIKFPCFFYSEEDFDFYFDLSKSFGFQVIY